MLKRIWGENKVSGKCAYESLEMAELLGETLRPGGFDLTDKGVSFCKWQRSDRLLDLGCGQGATVSYLEASHNLTAFGIDPSETLLERAKNKNAQAVFKKAVGEAIPFDDESFDGVLSECTLSLMRDREQVLKEVKRVLRKKGTFFVTDVYARNLSGLAALKEQNFDSCMRGLYDLELLQADILRMGFQIECVEDHSQLLKELLVKTVFKYGSMDAFWKKSGGNCAAGFQEILKKCKPGYYMLIARKMV